jgi:hypothetical protein
MNSMNDEGADREAIEALLPWYATGTLSARDAERVERALASDPELARRYELIREELNETIHLNETLGAPSAGAIEKLLAAIDAEGASARKPRASFDLGGYIAEFLTRFAPRTLAYAASAAVLAIVVQAAVITAIAIRDQRGGYQTASAPTEGAFIAIRFAPQASVTDITKFLDAYKASLAGGPRPGNLYKLRVAETAMSPDELAKIASRMAQDNVVSFAAAAP